MVEIAFLVCALSLPAENFTRPRITPWVMESDEESRLVDWLKKKGDYEEVFVHENPQEELLKRNGWERIPILWKGKHIWGKRKPRSDQKLIETSA